MSAAQLVQFLMVALAAVVAVSPVIVLVVAMIYGKAIVGLVRAFLHWFPRRRRMAIDMAGVHCDEALPPEPRCYLSSRDVVAGVRRAGGA